MKKVGDKEKWSTGWEKKCKKLRSLIPQRSCRSTSPDISPIPALRVLVDGESETEHSWEPSWEHVHQEAFIISEKKATSRSIVDRFLRSPLPSDKVGHLHDEGPADDRGDLDVGAPEGCLTQCHGEQKEKKHWQFEHRWRHFQAVIADLQICRTGTGATG